MFCGLARRLLQTWLLVLPEPGHSPRRDRFDDLILVVEEFLSFLVLPVHFTT